MKNEYVSTSVEQSYSPIELFGISERPSRQVSFNPEATGGEYVTSDCSFWLPLAAESYNISKNLRDYIMVPVPSLITEMPNTNGDCVTKEELLQFSTDTGLVAYKTFKAKGVYVEHANSDVSQAKGVILDVYLKQLKGFGNNKHFKVVKLLGLDRTKDPVLCNKILDGTITSYSMGLYFDSYSCSICNTRVGKNYGKPCHHTKLRQPTYVAQGGKLAYRFMHSLVGFETSIVVDPAYISAICPPDLILNR